MTGNSKGSLKCKALISAAGLAALTVCVIVTYVFDIETTSAKIIGSYVSWAVISAAAFRFSSGFYSLAVIFHFFAASLGSVINLYKTVGFYDKLVHMLSGILLAQAGIVIISYIFRKRKATQDNLLRLLFAFFFSCSCAGFWEIYEFTADTALGLNMQGGNSNTMGDIISGVLGALAYSVFYLCINRNKKQL